jgi:hypothetical protein
MADAASSIDGKPDSIPFSPGWVVVALIMWAILTFGHGEGLKIAGELFAWAKVKDNLHPDGGGAGLARLELLMTLTFGGIGLAVVGGLAFRLLRLQPTRRQLVEEGVTWALWAVLVLLIRKCFIVYATEFVHFAQYALIGALVCRSIDRGRRPQVAFLITFGLGILDEVWQHYGLHAGEKIHWMDWSDPILDGLGAAGGILPFVSLARLRGEKLPESWHLVKRTLVVASLLLLPLLLLDPRTTSDVLGHYRYHPIWGVYTNDKPTHWPGPRAGIPLVLAGVFVIGSLIEPRRRRLSQAGLLVLAALLYVSFQPFNRKDGMPVHEDVPLAHVARVDTGMVIDGVLDEPAWATAQRLGPFVRSLDGEDHWFEVDAAGEPTTRHELQPTYARLLWDDQNLYLAFEVSDRDVWARDTHRDDTSLPGDEVVELFLDDGGDEVTYYEFEFSPHGVVYDLFCYIPEPPVDFNPDVPFIAMAQWDAREVQQARQIDGSLALPERGTDLAELDEDGGWTLEVAIPWRNFRTETLYANTFVKFPPTPGQRWRMGLFRVERPRPDQSLVPGPDLSPAEARELVGISQEAFDALIAGKRLEPRPDGNFGRADVLSHRARAQAQYQAWAPTWSPSFHKPSFFGEVVFDE